MEGVADIYDLIYRFQSKSCTPRFFAGTAGRDEIICRRRANPNLGSPKQGVGADAQHGAKPRVHPRGFDLELVLKGFPQRFWCLQRNFSGHSSSTSTNHKNYSTDFSLLAMS